MVLLDALLVSVMLGLHRPKRPPTLSPTQIRAIIYRTHHCLAEIIDHEDGTWVPTRYGAGSSYGLPQANPGSKMRSAGADWATNPWTQLRWMEGYVRVRYGGECQAWAYWQAHGSY